MDGIRQIIFCMGTLSVTGIFGFAAVMIYWNISRKRNPFLMLVMIKAVMGLFCLPMVYAAVFLMRVKYTMGRWILIGEFWAGHTLPVRRISIILFAVWGAGCLAQIIRMLYKRQKLHFILRGNVAVDNPQWLKIFEEYKKKFSLSDVEFLQNDMLTSPVSTEIRHPKIILPFERYTDKQVRIILEHEMNHIKNNDLLWKKAGLVITWMHWFNPFVHMMWNQLVFMEEVVCDCKSSTGNPFYTQKEYGTFLAGLDDNLVVNSTMTALYESKNNIYRRIKIMLKAKETKKTKKIVTAGCCLTLTVAAVLPAGAVSVRAAELQDKWIHSTEHAVQAEQVDYSNPADEMHAVADGSVVEIDLTSDIEMYSSSIPLDFTIYSGTRVLYGYRYMFAGDSITISARCKDSSVTYRIGIKNETTGELVYEEGSGTLVHSFDITEEGRYSAYVENVCSTTMEVTGSAVYLN